MTQLPHSNVFLPCLRRWSACYGPEYRTASGSAPASTSHGANWSARFRGRPAGSPTGRVGGQLGQFETVPYDFDHPHNGGKGGVNRVFRRQCHSSPRLLTTFSGGVLKGFLAKEVVPNALIETPKRLGISDITPPQHTNQVTA